MLTGCCALHGLPSAVNEEVTSDAASRAARQLLPPGVAPLTDPVAHRHAMLTRVVGRAYKRGPLEAGALGGAD